MNNSQIMPYEFKGNPVRTITEGNEIWFIANDVCSVLGYGNPREALSKHVDKEDVTKCDTLTSGGRQKTNCVNESGLYALIFGSTLPAAKEFKRWVTKEVLPEIRKTGQYRSDVSAVLSETSIKKVKELYAEKADQAVVLRQEVYSLRLKLLLKTGRRHNEDDVRRMIELREQIDSGKLNMTEPELARAFRISADRYRLITWLYDEAHPEKALMLRNVYDMQMKKAMEAGDGNNS